MNNTLSGKLTSRGNLNGNVNTIVFAHNYNDLTNKPQINNVTLQGNKTASELGLATPEDITVTSVNEQTGDVVLSGSDIDYSVGMSLNAKIDDLESQIQGSGVQSVNGMTGNVTLTANDINYSTGVTIKNKIDAVEGEIPDVYVSTVNGNSGAVSITAQDVPMSGTDQTPTATAIGDLSDLTTSVTSSLVGAVKEVNAKADSFIYTDSTVTDFITLFASIPNNKTVGFLMNSGTVSNCPVPYPTGVIAKWNSNTAFIELTQLNGTDASYIGRVFSGNLTWRKITTTTA